METEDMTKNAKVDLKYGPEDIQAALLIGALAMESWRDVPGIIHTPRVAPQPERVLRNGRATIVFWKDGTKTVVKRRAERDDAEKAIAMAVVKKMYGSYSHFKKVWREWL